MAKQHRMMVSKLVMWTERSKKEKPSKRTKWRKLKDEDFRCNFRKKVIKSGVLEGQGDWEAVANVMRCTARTDFGNQLESSDWKTKRLVVE